LSIIQ
jgi:hypothetical protein